jgi:hypothetical protein
MNTLGTSMTNTEYFGIGGLGLAAVGAALGMVASMWTKAKDVVWRVIGLVIRRVEIPSQVAHDAVTSYLISKYRRSRNYDRVYSAAWECQRDGRYGLIPFEQFGFRTLIFWKWRVFPLIYTNQAEKKTNKTAAEQQANNNVTKIYGTLIYVRGTIDVDEILKEACAIRNAISWATEDDEEKSKTRFVIHHVPSRGDTDDDNDSGSGGMAWYQQGTYRLLAHTPDQLGKRPISNGKALDNLIYPKRVKDLIGEIELWHKSRDWYRERSIPWKRGWMLYGPPGTGKTALARAFAEDMNMPIYVYNLAEMSNHELIRTWTEMQKNVPCIALIEDIDNVFHGRENVARKNSGMFNMMMMPAKKDENDSGNGSGGRSLTPLTFDCLLNCLDGVERSDGIFTIITTNDISKVDAALGQPRQLPDGSTEFISTRPGRVDKAVELGYMEVNDKKKMARRILGEYEGPYLEMLEFIDRFPDLQETPAQFQERCAQVALKCFWAEKNAERELDEMMGPILPASERRALQAGS